MTSLILGLVFATAASAQAPGSDRPANMRKIVVRLMGPGIRPGSFAALPRTIYCAGSRYARVEDPPDARQRIEKLTIIAEPDAYSLNLIDKTGTHAIDHGGPEDIHLPVVLPFDPKHGLGHLDRLEFGDEIGFFESSGARKQAGPIVNGKPTESYVLQTPGGPATLVVKTDTDVPLSISWHSKGEVYKYEYIAYNDVPFNPALFEKPVGFQLREIQADNTNEEHI
ncbi:MAG TPA: hypothetical protein VH601_26425 [Bryobacteraceae bacterium]